MFYVLLLFCPYCLIFLALPFYVINCMFFHISFYASCAFVMCLLKYLLHFVKGIGVMVAMGCVQYRPCLSNYSLNTLTQLCTAECGNSCNCYSVKHNDLLLLFIKFWGVCEHNISLTRMAGKVLKSTGSGRCASGPTVMISRECTIASYRPMYRRPTVYMPQRVLKETARSMHPWHIYGELYVAS